MFIMVVCPSGQLLSNVDKLEVWTHAQGLVGCLCPEWSEPTFTDHINKADVRLNQRSQYNVFGNC